MDHKTFALKIIALQRLPQEDEMILVTGGAGFIGSNFVLDWIEQVGEPVINLDKLTYAGNLNNLSILLNDSRHTFVKGDVCDTQLVAELLSRYMPRAIVHFAAESHVDRSIRSPADFITTNVNGTFSLLEASLKFWMGLPEKEKSAFRFLHISTDEVYGSLDSKAPAFSETTPYAPNSPYSASKAGSDHLVRAYHHTYGLPTLTTNCSNNYGPFQFPEKLVPLFISNALENKALPIYGDGKNIRDWLHVRDHCHAVRLVLSNGAAGETFNIGGGNQKTNLEVVHTLCGVLDQLVPKQNGKSYSEQITFVKDRPGHDRRYAIDAGKISRDLGWMPTETFESGIRKTVHWYLDHQDWIRAVRSGEYLNSVERNCSNRNGAQV